MTGIPLKLEVFVIEAPSYCCSHYVLRLVELHMYCDSMIIILKKLKLRVVVMENNEMLTVNNFTYPTFFAVVFITRPDSIYYVL